MNNLTTNGLVEQKFERFIGNIRSDLLNEKVKNSLVEKNNVLDMFSEVIAKKKTKSYRKKWTLISTIQHINNLVNGLGVRVRE